mgnify:CR=1 FL=1
MQQCNLLWEFTTAKFPRTEEFSTRGFLDNAEAVCYNNYGKNQGRNKKEGQYHVSL